MIVALIGAIPGGRLKEIMEFHYLEKFNRLSEHTG
jgi:hypothetical protein